MRHTERVEVPQEGVLVVGVLVALHETSVTRKSTPAALALQVRGKAVGGESCVPRCP
jgi:hypothetical protein